MIKSIKYILATLICAVMLTSATMAATNTTPSWNLELSGVGTTQIGGTHDSSVGGTLGLGKDIKFILPAEIGVRETLSYKSADSSWIGNTEVFLDWQLKLGRLTVFAGPSANVSYGNTALAWKVGPEAGAKWALTSSVYAFARGNYDFDLVNKHLSGSDHIRYTFGLGWKF